MSGHNKLSAEEISNEIGPMQSISKQVSNASSYSNESSHSMVSLKNKTETLMGHMQSAPLQFVKPNIGINVSGTNVSFCLVFCILTLVQSAVEGETSNKYDRNSANTSSLVHMYIG